MARNGRRSTTTPRPVVLTCSGSAQRFSSRSHYFFFSNTRIVWNLKILPLVRAFPLKIIWEVWYAYYFFSGMGGGLKAWTFFFSIGGGKVLNIPVSGIPPLCDNSHWNSHEFTVQFTGYSGIRYWYYINHSEYHFLYQWISKYASNWGIF